jgi:hypothetical protein
MIYEVSLNKVNLYFSWTSLYTHYWMSEPKVLRHFCKMLAIFSLVSFQNDGSLSISQSPYLLTYLCGLNMFFVCFIMHLVLSLIMATRASLTINKYLEEFPGLVHFLYIDRFNHRITAPSLDFDSEETTSLTKKKARIIEYLKSSLLNPQILHMCSFWNSLGNICRSFNGCKTSQSALHS